MTINEKILRLRKARSLTQAELGEKLGVTDKAVSKWEQGNGMPDLEQIPARHRLPKKEKSGFVFIITNSKGEFFIRRRTEKGLLSGLYEFPWSEDKLFTGAKDSGLTVSHVFTHFKLTLHICFLKMQKTPTPDGCFIRPEKLGDYPVSTLMKKVFATAQNHLELFENPKQ